MNKKLEEIREFILDKVSSNHERIGGRLPRHVDETGKYIFSVDGGWIGGFWPGINWLCYEMSGEQKYIEMARLGYHTLRDRLYFEPETLDHDIGFLYILSALADYKLTKDESCKNDILKAANELMSRYNEKGKFIQAWNVWVEGNEFCENNRGRIIVDCMYNLPLLFWCAKEEGLDRAYEIAVNHANTCAKYSIRDDYSSFHTYVFDPVTGNPRFGQTCQGHSDDSCWSRGESWLIGGFAYAYAYTKNEKYLKISKETADYFIAHLEDDLIPMWDFKFKGSETEERDTSAASIAASGMLELSKYLNDEEASYYSDMAEKIIMNVYEKYASKDMPEYEGLILHACGNKPGNEGDHDTAIIYGDYYFVEAVAKLLGKTVNYWI